MSEVTDILCAVSSGDLVAAGSSLDVSAWPLALLSTPGTSGTGESALLSCAVEDDESGLLRSDRDDRERSERESGRGVASDASSKLSCRMACDQQALSMVLMLPSGRRRGILTPSLSELCELVGLSLAPSAGPGSAMVTAAVCQIFESQEAAVMGQQAGRQAGTGVASRCSAG
jgi:hypothetical protein